MKKILLILGFLWISNLSFSQQKHYYHTLGGFDYYDITNKSVSPEKLLKGEFVGTHQFCDGFNHYEINLSNQSVVHNYISTASGVKDRKESLYTMENCNSKSSHVSFDVMTEDFGKMTFVVSKDASFKNDLVVIFRENNRTYAATIKK